MTASLLPTFAVSAPGKVIIFGEHAAVYNKPAIAAALSLRTYLYVTPNDLATDNVIRLEFPDVGLKFECPTASLPWHLVQKLDDTPPGSRPSSASSSSTSSTAAAQSLDELNLDEHIVSELHNILKPKTTNSFQYAALLAFFYLYLHICDPSTPAHTFVTKSTLPVGAGLGSSATYAVCLSTAFLTLTQQLSIPTVEEEPPLSRAPTHEDKNNIENVFEKAASDLLSTPPITPTLESSSSSSSNKIDGSSTSPSATTDATVTEAARATAAAALASTTSVLCLGNADHDLINKWSYIGEKCLHGNPSGIDNTVACRGGAVLFQRPSTLIPMKRFPALKLLLTNTKHPRRTKDLVARVGDLYETFQSGTQSILDAIEHVTQEAFVLLGSAERTSETSHTDVSGSNTPSKKTGLALPVKTVGESPDAVKRLLQLIRINHGLLVSLGVSHPKLEKVKSIGDQLHIGETKLTGAGGGGCAITLLHVDDVENDTESAAATIDERLDEFRARLENTKNGFEIFETVLGGPGVGLATGLDVAHFSHDEFLSLNRAQLEGFDWKYWG
ncbi:uncharacterized protein SAPINGB_P001959 [Magnusiomyces paraingens]|uniref:mevalonate kinase n=1 Tax=Magnusiomyces paraingens TaxID=2606893 RepID=A0A5E8BC15_9ASCO|nr:uncharacterized protein SAPINGB_P001959 [Saprochaete ingens]VVT48803.1 unnamed protein product [Saprochaete ingens]